ncbi:unnamed protein product, partial [Musa acuminata var. zebrina]
MMLSTLVFLLYHQLLPQVLCDKDRSAKEAPGVGNLERRILQVNWKRVKVIKPGS